jgi:putative transposase
MYPDEDLPARRSIRLPQFDYTQIAQYFITICAFEMRCLFGRVENNLVLLNAIGRIAEECWREIPEHFPRLALESFVVMPNHLHGILTIKDGHGDAVPLQDARRLQPPPSQPEQFQRPVAGSIPTILRSYKAAVTYRARHKLRRTDMNVWQSNYFERVLRTGKEFEAASRYIAENPQMWHLDKAYQRRDANHVHPTPCRTGRGTASPCPSSAGEPRTRRPLTQPR